MSVKSTWVNGEQFQAADANAVAEAVNSAYVKPGTGIPASDLASAVQTSLGKADTAVQSVASTNITDATTTGKAVLTATDAAAARTTLGVAYGSTGGTVCEGNDSRLSPSSTSISDATATGRALITATDAAEARTTLGVPATSHSHAVTDINASTTLALGVGSIELGNASDTTLSRSAAGVLAVEGVNVPTISSTSTLTNKRITPRIGTTASSATPSIDTDAYDQYNITALAAAITGITVTGTPTDGQKLMIRIKDNGTARAITWGSSFQSSGVGTLLTTTAISKTHHVGFIWDAAVSKWVCIAADSTGY